LNSLCLTQKINLTSLFYVKYAQNLNIFLKRLYLFAKTIIYKMKKILNKN